MTTAKAPKDMTQEEALAALKDPEIQSSHDKIIELRDRLVEIDGSFSATKGIDPNYEIPDWALLISQ